MKVRPKKYVSFFSMFTRDRVYIRFQHVKKKLFRTTSHHQQQKNWSHISMFFGDLHQCDDRARFCVLAPNGHSSMSHGYMRLGLAVVSKDCTI